MVQRQSLHRSIATGFMIDMKNLIERLRVWLILRLGGQLPPPVAETAKEHMLALQRIGYISVPIWKAAKEAYLKVKADPSWKIYSSSHLGQNPMRDEAVEWAKLYLRERKDSFRGSDVNLACEIMYHLKRK